MQPYDFENSISYWILRAAQAVERAFNDGFAPHGITMAQSKVLGWLAHDGELSQAELAERLHVEPPTLAGILDRMERDGWVERHPAPGDRRRKVVRPTKQVEPVWAKIVQCARVVRARATAGVDAEDLQRTFAVLAAIQGNLRPKAEEPD